MGDSARIVAFIQARMNSSRLPGKVLKNIAGQPMLGWVIERARMAKMVNEVGVATTNDPSDNPVEDFCIAHKIPVYRGDQFDVLDRYYQAARQFKADIIVRITGDCPLIDPGEIDHTILEFLRSGVDFAANRLPPPWKRTYPIGLDTEVCTFSALERAWKEAIEPYEREHVMPYFYDKEGRFRYMVVNHDPDYGSLRWTVDTMEDLEFIRRVIEELQNRNDFSWTEVLGILDRNHDLMEINAGIRHKNMREVDDRIKP